MSPSDSLFVRTLDGQARDNRNAIATIEAGRREIQQLEQLAAVLWALGVIA